MNIKRNSWHHKLANFGTVRVDRWEKETNVCEYCKAVMAGSIAFICVSTFLSIIAISLTYGAYDWISSVFFTDEKVGLFGLIFFVLVSLAGITAILAVWIWLKKQFKYKIDVAPPTSFVTILRKKWSDKVCFTIKIED